MKETVFFAEEIEFTYPGEQISDNEISELDVFPGKEGFVLFHIPFALDVVENPFWIDIQTGEIIV